MLVKEQGGGLCQTFTLNNPNRLLSFQKNEKCLIQTYACVPFKSFPECNLVEDMFTVEVPSALRISSSAH